MILTKNFFKYCDSFGTAMGSAFAPSYACLDMGLWEEKCIHNQVQNIFLCRKLCCEKPLNFLEYINSIMYYLSFHMEQHKSSVNFLDLTLYKRKNSYYWHHYLLQTLKQEYSSKSWGQPSRATCLISFWDCAVAAALWQISNLEILKWTGITQQHASH